MHSFVHDVPKWRTQNLLSLQIEVNMPDRLKTESSGALLDCRFSRRHQGCLLGMEVREGTISAD